MSSLGTALLVVAFVVVASLAFVFSVRQAQARRDALSALAARLGWRFDADHDRGHDERYRQFPIFRRGHSRSAHNTLGGEVTIGGRVYRGRMGDFTYKVTRSNGKSTTTTTHHFSYLILHPPFAVPPDLHIRPEGLLDKLAGALGFDDIDFESSEFSKRFHVRSSDKRFAYDVLSPQMVEFLLASSGVAIEFDGGCCCLSDGRVRWRPEAFEQNLAWLGRFFERWPEFLVRQLEGGVHA